MDRLFYWPCDLVSDPKSKRRKKNMKAAGRNTVLPTQVPSQDVKAKELGKIPKDPPNDAHPEMDAEASVLGDAIAAMVKWCLHNVRTSPMK